MEIDSAGIQNVERFEYGAFETSCFGCSFFSLYRKERFKKNYTEMRSTAKGMWRIYILSKDSTDIHLNDTIEVYPREHSPKPRDKPYTHCPSLEVKAPISYCKCLGFPSLEHNELLIQLI